MSFDEAWPLLRPALIAVWIAYLVVLAGWIVMQKREPIATLSWLLSLALLPVLGLVIYHFLGPQRIKRHRLRRSRSRASVDDALPTGLKASEDCTTIARLGRSATGFSPSTATRLELLVGGGAGFFELAVKEAFPLLKVSTPDTPVFANARGFWRMGV